jgi:hypothetical protein
LVQLEQAFAIMRLIALGASDAQATRLVMALGAAKMAPEAIHALPDQIVARLLAADTALVQGRMYEAVRHLESAESAIPQAQRQAFEDALAQANKRELKLYSTLRAQVPVSTSGSDIKEVPPDLPLGHGTSLFTGMSESVEEVKARLETPGFEPPRGGNRNLLEHTDQHPDRAFRGTTLQPVTVEGQGGAAWTHGKGTVLEVTGVPGWDTNAHLEGRFFHGGEYKGNPKHGEGEISIPAHIPPEAVRRFGDVTEPRPGKFEIEWHDNPRYDPNWWRGTR